MTARDYARVALLYLQDGIFNNERILPEGWVDYSVTPASASNNGYGSFFWLNGAGEIPSAPEDMYMCIGHDGQRIFIVPSQYLAVVILIIPRMGQWISTVWLEIFSRPFLNNFILPQYLNTY